MSWRAVFRCPSTPRYNSCSSFECSEGVGALGALTSGCTRSTVGTSTRKRITQEQAQELLECLFVKLNHFPEANQADNDTLRNISLAGQTPEGRDASNELTYMCIEASGKLMLPEPKINVRFFPDSPPSLVRASCRALAKGANTLAMFNDEVAIPSLVRLGIALEEARDYCNDGCSELIMGGKGTIKFKVHNALPVLIDLVLSTDSQQYTTFDEVMADYKFRLTQLMPEEPGPARPITFPFLRRQH